MSVKQIFDELKVIKQEYERYEKKERILGIGLVMLLLGFIIAIKIDFNTVYWSVWIVCVLGVLMSRTKREFWEKQKNLVLKYRNYYNDNMIPAILDNYYEVIQYAGAVSYNREELKYITYFAELENVIVKNYFEGIHKGINFIQAVIRTDIIYAGEYGETADFNGRFFMMDINKNVDFVYIYSKNYKNKPSFMKGLDRIETEDIEFNSYFDIAAVNSEEAFYVLTPHFMDVLMDLYKRYGSVGVLCKNKHIYVMFCQLNEQSCDIDANITKDLDYLTEASRIKNFFGLVNVLIDELGMNLCGIEDDRDDDNEEGEVDEKKRKTDFLSIATTVINEISEMEDFDCSEVTTKANRIE